MQETATPAPGPEPAFVLVRPQLGENIGAAARGMWNFGLSRLRLVAPRDGWPNPAAVPMATGAGRVLDGACAYGSTSAAVADCTHVLATTARPRDLTKTVLTPEEAARNMAARIRSGERVAVLFGPERTGLLNEDVALANAVVTVDVNPLCPSINLAACVLLMAYEWRRATHAAPAVVEHMAGAAWATQSETEHLLRHWEERLAEAGFFWPAHKEESMKLHLRNLFSRQRLTGQDVQLLHGVMRQMVRWARRGGRALEGSGEGA
jgi:tRNA/rRNA methyltransferase